MNDENLPVTQSDSNSEINRKIANLFTVETDRVEAFLSKSAFRDHPNISLADKHIFKTVCLTYGLNPFLRQIYAFKSRGGSIQPMVGVDGWTKLATSHPNFGSVQFKYHDKITTENGRTCFDSVECLIYLKSHEQPVSSRAFYDNCKRNTPAWQSNPLDMLEHRARVKAIRCAFAFGGIFAEGEEYIDDDNEVKDVTKTNVMSVVEGKPKTLTKSTETVDEDGVVEEVIEDVQVEEINEELDLDHSDWLEKFDGEGQKS